MSVTFKVEIEKLSDDGLDQYKDFLFKCILNKRDTEDKRIAVLNRVDAVTKEKTSRNLH